MFEKIGKKFCLVEDFKKIFIMNWAEVNGGSLIVGEEIWPNSSFLSYN